MFGNHEDVECILDKVNLRKKDEVEVTFRIQKIPYELANAIAPDIADRLFRKRGSDWQPVDNVPSISFQEGIPVQDVHWRTAPDVPRRALWRNCQISGIRGKKSFKDQVTWTLYFRLRWATDDKITAGELHSMLGDSLFLTMEESEEPQGTLFPPAPEGAVCKIHRAPATYIGTDASLWCDDCVKSAVGLEVTKIGPAQ